MWCSEGQNGGEMFTAQLSQCLSLFAFVLSGTKQHCIDEYGNCGAYNALTRLHVTCTLLAIQRILQWVPMRSRDGYRCNMAVQTIW
jgi:mannose/fructose/N-acetylgalactosamine-specific phosphotransferase system component IIC